MAVQYLDEAERGLLEVEIQKMAEQLHEKSLRIAFFAPYNSGKSTLINALLGTAILPMGITPTTACPITVKYGDKEQTSITSEIGPRTTVNGLDILKSIATLRNQEQPSKVRSIEIFVPMFQLLNNVELLDLPGTEDQEILNEIVQEQLLKADVIIQVINAQQPFSKAEREKVTDWLLSRGLNSVIFVLNFANFKEARQKRLIWNEVKHVAKKIRSDLPAGLTNLYQVDALPALQARDELRYSYKAVSRSGLIKFQAALLTTVYFYHRIIEQKRLFRGFIIASRIKELLRPQVAALRREIQLFNKQRAQEIQTGQLLEKSLREDFEHYVAQLTEWLSYNNLLINYQQAAADALKNSNFQAWEASIFTKTKEAKIALVNSIASRIAEIYGTSELSLEIPTVAYPIIYWPDAPSFTTWEKVKNFFGDGEEKAWRRYTEQRNKVAEEGASNYLFKFSQQSLQSLNAFAHQTQACIRFNPSEVPLHIRKKKHYYAKLDEALLRIEKVVDRKIVCIRSIGFFKPVLHYIISLLRLHYHYIVKEKMYF